MKSGNFASREDFATITQVQESQVTAGPELTVVVPTLNERDNIPIRLKQVAQLLREGGGHGRHRPA